MKAKRFVSALLSVALVAAQAPAMLAEELEYITFDEMPMEVVLEEGLMEGPVAITGEESEGFQGLEPITFEEAEEPGDIDPEELLQSAEVLIGQTEDIEMPTEAGDMEVAAPVWEMSDDGQLILIDRPEIIGDADLYDITYSMFRLDGTLMGSFKSDEARVAMPLTADGEYIVYVTVADGLNQKVVDTGVFFVIANEGKYGVTYDPEVAMAYEEVLITVKTPQDIEAVTICKADGSIGEVWSDAENYEDADGVRVWTLDERFTSAGEKELTYKVSRDGASWIYLTKAPLKVVENQAVALYGAAASVITKQPVAKETTIGAAETLTVVAENAASYRWYYSSDNGTTWKKVVNTTPGYNKATLKLTITETVLKYLYRCDVTGTNGEVLSSNAVQFTLPPAPAGLRIVTQPVARETTVGAAETLQVVAENAASYRWYYSADNGTTWKKVANTTVGYNKSLLKLTITETVLSRLYRCEVTGKEGEVLNSDAVQFMLPAVPAGLQIVTQPVAGETTVGAAESLTVVAENAASYRWYYSTDNGTTWKKVVNTTPGYNRATLKLTITETVLTYLYRCEVTGKEGEVLNSDAVQFTLPSVPAKLEIVTQPVAGETSVGAAESLTVVAENAAAYRWYYSTDNGTTWKKVANTTPGYNKATLKLTITEKVLSYLYRCEVTGKEGDVLNSDAVQFTLPEETDYNGFTYETVSGVMTITGYIGTDTTLVIPGDINGTAVLALAEDAFKGNTVITSAYIPAGITVIPAGAFDGCTALATVELSENVTVFGRRCFAGCTSLANMNPYN